MQPALEPWSWSHGCCQLLCLAALVKKDTWHHISQQGGGQEHTLPLVEIWGVICVTVRSCAHLKSMSKDMLNGSRTGRNLSDQTSQDTSKDCTSAVCGKRSLANGKVEDHGKLHQIENCNDFTEIHNI